MREILQPGLRLWFERDFQSGLQCGSSKMPNSSFINRQCPDFCCCSSHLRERHWSDRSVGLHDGDLCDLSSSSSSPLSMCQCLLPGGGKKESAMGMNECVLAQGEVNNLDLTRSILFGMPRSQITPRQIKWAGISCEQKEKKMKKVLRKLITGEEREGEEEGVRGEKVRRTGYIQRIQSFASLTLSPRYKGPNIFSGFSVAQSSLAESSPHCEENHFHSCKASDFISFFI